jgi:predicted ribosome quality control (RQC) complex YloA/Tae2 family protein
LEGGRIASLGERAIAVLRNGVDAYVLQADLRGRVTLLEGGDAERAPSPLLIEPDRPRLETRGAALAEQLASTALTDARAALARALSKGLARIDRRIEAIQGDLARIAEADALAARAQLFVAEASRAPRGARALKVVDWSTGEGVTVELPLDPARPAREQLDAMFKRARRLKEGARIGRQRLADAEGARAKVAAVAAEVTLAATQAALEELGRRAKALAPRDVSLVGPAKGAGHRSAGGQAPKPPYRTFLASDGERILVGRGAAHNDAVTFRVGRPHDLWLHAKGYTGAHVIVPLPKNGSCPAERLVEAAHLASHFSDAKDETVVEVQYTPRRYLRKPRGSVPGFVVVDREKVMMLRRDEAVLRRLLEREEVA